MPFTHDQVHRTFLDSPEQFHIFFLADEWDFFWTRGGGLIPYTCHWNSLRRRTAHHSKQQVHYHKLLLIDSVSSGHSSDTGHRFWSWHRQKIQEFQMSIESEASRFSVMALWLCSWSKTGHLFLERVWISLFPAQRQVEQFQCVLSKTNKQKIKREKIGMRITEPSS